MKRSISKIFLAAGLLSASGIGYVVAHHPDQLLQASARNGIAITVAPLVQLGANVRPADVRDDPLWLAAYRGHTETVRALLAAGADPHREHNWALRLAAEYGRTDTVRLLLTHGADVHAKNDAALRLAANNGHTEMVKLLLDAGANPRVMNDQALQWALENGHSGTADVLRHHISQRASPSPRL